MRIEHDRTIQPERPPTTDKAVLPINIGEQEWLNNISKRALSGQDLDEFALLRRNRWLVVCRFLCFEFNEYLTSVSSEPLADERHREVEISRSPFGNHPDRPQPQSGGSKPPDQTQRQ